MAIDLHILFPKNSDIIDVINAGYLKYNVFHNNISILIAVCPDGYSCENMLANSSCKTTTTVTFFSHCSS